MIRVHRGEDWKLEWISSGAGPREIWINARGEQKTPEQIRQERREDAAASVVSMAQARRLGEQLAKAPKTGPA
jgi:hypothetical protein